MAGMKDTIHRIYGKTCKADKKLRRCLKCLNEFRSAGPTNRICLKCTRSNDKVRVQEGARFISGR